MVRPLVGTALGIVLSAPAAFVTYQDDARVRKQLIAHRGASGYAPEHTLPAYRLSLDYGVDFDEMLALVRGRAGVYPELKSPAFYAGRGVDMVKIFADSVRRHGLDRPDSLKSTPVIVQSFDEASVRRLARELPAIPRVFLTSHDRDVTEERLREVATFATGIAPDKRVIARHPDMVARAHALGLTVTSWTFRADEKTAYPTVRDEMAQYLYTWGIDALFTNHPDQFPRR